jgi:hypothetical protein
MVAAQQPVGSYLTGSVLLAKCQKLTEQDQAQCVGYIQGISDALDLTRSYSGLGPCIGTGTLAIQVEQVVLRALIANPDKLHYSGAVLVRDAIIDAWHCGYRGIGGR